VTTRRRILVVHYFFPPLGGGGVARILKFVKYLPELGWDVTVLASPTTSRWYAVRDEGLLAEVPPSVSVVRPRELPVADARRRLRSPLARLRLPQLEHFIGWPDETAGWLPATTLTALRLARTWRPDAVLSSSYAYSAHLVGLAASRAARAPWLADFRDEWTLNPQGTALPRPLGQLNARTERALVRRADRVVLADSHYRLVGLDEADPRRVVIHNGVDESDLAAPSANGAVAPGGTFRLTYVGALYGARDAAPVFAAIARLVRAGIIDPARFEVSIVGNVWLGPGPLGDGSVPVSLTGYVDHDRALREMSAATALLFYAPASTRATSGKIFEYLTSGRPVLAVARADNLASQLVDELGAGTVAAPDDPPAIDGALTELYRRWQAGSLAVAPSVRKETLRRFSRRHLTGTLARTLEDAITRPLRP
jgi:glycosyltransferase involved in cell wall biosynthesis